jgi:glycosyltransferase involved in cell wall biosynthesis
VTGPLVSVNIAAFNAATTIGATLRSALAQTYDPIEIIVVEDGSRDETAKIVEAMAERDPRLRLIRAAHLGAARARNLALAHSNGDYVAPLDADDLWHPEKIARQVAAALAAPEPPGFVYTFHVRVDANGRVITVPPATMCRGRAFHRLYHRNFVGTGSACLFRRDALAGVGGFEPVHNADDILPQLRVAALHSVEHVPGRLVGYRQLDVSMSRRPGAFEGWWDVRERAAREWTSVPPFLRRWERSARLLALAENRAVAGRFVSALGAMARAFLLDPRRVLCALRWRAARRLARRKGPFGGDRQPGFGDGDLPFLPHGDDPWRDLPAAQRLRALEEGRLERLRRLDEST